MRDNFNTFSNDDLLSGLEPWMDSRGSDIVGFKFHISFKKLGRTLKKLAKSKELRAALAVGMKALDNPMISASLGIPPGTMQGIKAGASALGLVKRAQAGDERAASVVKRAMADDYTSADSVTADNDSVPVARCPCCGSVY